LVTTTSSNDTFAPLTTKPSPPLAERSICLVVRTCLPSNVHVPALPRTSIATRTSFPVAASVGADAASVTFHAFAAVRIANSVPFAAVLVERSAACDHGGAPPGCMSSASAAQREAFTTVSKRTVASKRKFSRCGPNVSRESWEVLGETPTRRPFSTVQDPSTAAKPAGRPGPSKRSSRTVWADAAAGSARAAPTARMAPIVRGVCMDGDACAARHRSCFRAVRTA
jgi:hypothetical protein